MKRKVMKEAVDKVFDTYLGKAITTCALENLALQQAGITPKEWVESQRKISTYIRNRAEEGYLIISAGKDGGVRRVQDMTPEDLKHFRRLNRNRPKIIEIDKEISRLQDERRKLTERR